MREIENTFIKGFFACLEYIKIHRQFTSPIDYEQMGEGYKATI